MKAKWMPVPKAKTSERHSSNTTFGGELTGAGRQNAAPQQPIKRCSPPEGVENEKDGGGFRALRSLIQMAKGRWKV
jgi:hypothetical protein